MLKYRASLSALGWAILVLFSHFLFIAAESHPTTFDATNAGHNGPAFAAGEAANHLGPICNLDDGSGSLHKLLCQSYLKPNAGNTGRASDRIMKDLTEIYKSETYKKGLINVTLVNDNLYHWEVRLSIADKDSELHKDLVKYYGGEDYIVLRVKFDDNYPNEPPFVRIASPFLIGEHVERGGTLCMKLLSKNGWDNQCTLESPFLSITILLIEGKTRVDSVKSSPDTLEHIYNEDEARDNFASLVRFMERAGWYNI